MPRILHCRPTSGLSRSKALLGKNFDSHRRRLCEPASLHRHKIDKNRIVSSAYIFVPNEINKISDWPQKVKSAFIGNEDIVDELSATKFDRRCGLPLPAILRKKISLESDKLRVLDVAANWHEKCTPVSQLAGLYLQLSKARLSSLVVVTALGGFAMCPQLCVPWLSFLACVAGTSLTSFGANSLNQFLEAPFDAQMKRTQNRVMPRRALSSVHCLTFGLISGFLGVLILYSGCNAITASLGLCNILLYTAIYTPMKRYSVYNTWVGSVVGAVPPVMGWTACGGSLDAAGLVLAAILFAWQFPHFNALSWNLRADYSKAGYRMMAACRPDLLRRTTLTYSASLLGLSSVMAPWAGLTTWTFALTSAPLNFYFAYLAWKFYQETDSRNSKKLFRCSLVYLPILITLMFLSKPSDSVQNC